ncbi:MAG: hypothetical protein A3I61_05055 [Acidobacteria bacterium RIFCSPLOWO2_02_FULL_68_18]|nr:MAG: hypothetical protein A3I61_05055 [Acidobacteria bacterium RIFCSPLOWO2_02_FULL_68_18]OFW51283.1 MAG: hypothetical protein A3G77_05505 [Acidobacteria bacterium RIFCSPLOWO2_12_FULL_68_19]
MRRTIAAALLSLTAALPAFAEETAAPAAAPAIVVPARVERTLARPAVLPALYVSYAALQVYDVYSTRQALARGAQEANPLMQGVVGNAGALWAVKAGATAGAILAAERLWKRDKKAAAIGVMVASNAVAALVASRNASTLRHLR